MSMREFLDGKRTHSDSEDGLVLERLCHHALYGALCRNVHRRRRFIHHHDVSVPQQRPRHAEQLKQQQQYSVTTVTTH